MQINVSYHTETNSSFGTGGPLKNGPSGSRAAEPPHPQASKLVLTNRCSRRLLGLLMAESIIDVFISKLLGGPSNHLASSMKK